LSSEFAAPLPNWRIVHGNFKFRVFGHPWFICDFRGKNNASHLDSPSYDFLVLLTQFRVNFFLRIQGHFCLLSG
jgi:hypothetical protein